mmetsp:Transcript_5984/g.11779  ORF Transcript_5984/g.11779 Transcript_5984/m.11779 type:complete len:82 (-) Transcript_5984:659-904(-)
MEKDGDLFSDLRQRRFTGGSPFAEQPVERVWPIFTRRVLSSYLRFLDDANLIKGVSAGAGPIAIAVWGDLSRAHQRGYHVG